MHVQRYTILVWELHPCSRIEEIDVNRCQWRLDKLGQTIRCQRQLFLDSLAIGEVTRREITVPQALICEKVFIRTLPFYLEPQKILTLTSEDSWPTSTGLLWLSCLLFQDSPTTFRSTTPEIFSSLISIEPLVGAVCGDRNSGISFFFSSAISFTDKGLKWFGQDQGLLVQALKRVGTLPVIPIVTVNWRLPCSHLLSNMCSPWLPSWRS